MSTTTENSVSIQDLPGEILADIFACLDSFQASHAKLYDEPNFEVTDSTTKPLKVISQVSVHWRRIVLPLLFQYVRLQIWGRNSPLLRLSSIHQWFEPFRDFLIKRSLGSVIQRFTLCVDDDDSLLTTSEHYAFLEFSQFWEDLFQVFDPVDVLLVAPVRILGLLCGCHISMQNTFMLDSPCQYLLLQRDTHRKSYPTIDAASGSPKSDTWSVSGEASPASQNSKNTRTDTRGTIKSSGKLFAIRPWTKLLLNEGSFIKAYNTEEFWELFPPSILDDLLGSDSRTDPAKFPPTVRSLSYIAIFPIYFTIITVNLPPLDHLYVQLLPRSDILYDNSIMTNANVFGLWNERRSAYSLLMRELFREPITENFRQLKQFESGDAIDKESWQKAIDYLPKLSKRWKVASDGVFVKDLEQSEDQDDQSLLKSSLVRWAWNGSAELPVSRLLFGTNLLEAIHKRRTSLATTSDPQH